MTTVARFGAVWMLLGGMLVSSASAAAGVEDAGKFFSAATVEKAEQKIGEIRRQFRHDLLIETVPRVPADLEPQYKEQGKARFFREWAERRAEKARVNGVYLLICREPGHMQAEVDKATRQRAFTLEDRDRLVGKMTGLLREKKNDAALAEAVDFVATTMRANLAQHAEGGAAPAQRPLAGGKSLLGWVCLGAAVLVAVWAVIAIVRAFTRRATPTGPGEHGGGYGSPGGYGGPGGGGLGGGGLWGSLLTGMLGAAAGSWIYDRFVRGDASGGGESSPFGRSADQGSAPPSEPGAGDFGGDSGGGGDFDQPAEAPEDSAGDFGGDFDSGGDFGGGDFGGDSGGGGDF